MSAPATVSEDTSPHLRPPATPLVTVDPFFSIWSMSDRLFDDHTRHWTTTRMSIVGLAHIDGRAWRFCGRTRMDSPNWSYRSEPPGMEQRSLSVDPLSTRYCFYADGVELTVRFMTPLLAEDLDILSRPFSYMEMSAKSLDGRTHRVSLYVDVSAEAAVDTPDQKVVWDRAAVGSDRESLMIGTRSQNVLGKRGDDVRIDWGYLHLLGEQANATGVYLASDARSAFISEQKLPEQEKMLGERGKAVSNGWPVLCARYDLGEVGESAVDTLSVFGYDDGYAIEYFGARLSAYCFRNGASFSELFERAVSEYPKLSERCDRFDEELKATAREAGGTKYADICSLAYRQAIAAHKLVADENGEPLFLSKECFSNGSIGTIDVTYPSTPLFFYYNPQLVEAMLTPIFRFASSLAWPKAYAPHDVGTYPRANGQTYGVRIDEIDENRQMPVEECGNMLILTAALCRVLDSTALAESNWNLLKQWADYLLQHGYDPDHQLCTDDFAGHLAHNANLSVKAIVALAAFSDLCEMTGNAKEGAEYLSAARDFAGRWESDSREDDHHKLTLTDPGTWSLKYNLMWDKLLDYGLFSSGVFEREVAWYRACRQHYGTPLDSRSLFTKADWIVWAACLTDDQESFRELVEPIWDFLNETPSRTPFCDWYGTTDAAEHSFHHRSVVGGIFMKFIGETFRKTQSTKRSTKERQTAHAAGSER